MESVSPQTLENIKTIFYCFIGFMAGLIAYMLYRRMTTTDQERNFNDL